MPGEATSKPRGIECFDALYEAHVSAIYGYLFRRVGRSHAEELTAEVFAQAWVQRDRYDPSLGSPATWLFAIATNLLRHHYRSEDRRRRALIRLDPPGQVSSGEDELLAGIVAGGALPRVAAALLELEAVDRDCIYLFAVAGLSYDEIATSLSLPLGTVKSRMRRARLRLRSALRGFLDVEH
jgi:RNA polymerase sigma-70 factor (ECF subfamily)